MKFWRDRFLRYANRLLSPETEINLNLTAPVGFTAGEWLSLNDAFCGLPIQNYAKIWGVP